MPLNLFRGNNSTTPDYWPPTSDAFPPLAGSLSYFDAVGFLNRRNSANDFLNQRQQQLEEQGAFVHPEENWTGPVDDPVRMEADEEYRNALIRIRQNHKNSSGRVPENVRQATYEQELERLEEW